MPDSVATFPYETRLDILHPSLSTMSKNVRNARRGDLTASRAGLSAQETPAQTAIGARLEPVASQKIVLEDAPFLLLMRAHIASRWKTHATCAQRGRLRPVR